MKRFGWRWLVVNSLLLTATAGVAETRPQYGGVLHIATHAAFLSLDPADRTQPDSFARRNLTRLIFETLTTSADGGRLRPALATSWQASPGSQRWQFRLRRGVKFDDGTPLTPEIAASSLRAANPSWRVFADAESVTIDCEAANTNLPAELALTRNAIARKNTDGRLSGTGPFHISDWQPGKKLSLAAEEDYWGGRPFLDAIEVELGKNFHDQAMALEMGRTDLIEVPPEQAHRISMDGRRVISSVPVELVALAFAKDAQSPEDKILREALALSIDRASMRSALLQGTGQPAASILPNWMSGYAFVFPTDADLQRARHDREQVQNIPSWRLGYDAGDSVARLLAERIALNAKDAGLALQPTAGTAADVRLVTIPLVAADPWLALFGVAEAMGLAKPKMNSASAEDLYAAEQALLATERMIPLFHLPVSYVTGAELKGWVPPSDGSWDLADAWLESGKR